MHAYLRRGLYVGLMVGGGILFSAGQASADDSTTGSDSALGGNQVAVSASAPVTVSGNGLAVVGDSTSSDSTATDRAPVAPSVAASRTTSGQDSVAAGNQATLSVSAPVAVTGNSIAVVGDSASSSSTTSSTPAPDRCPRPARGPRPRVRTRWPGGTR